MNFINDLFTFTFAIFGWVTVHINKLRLRLLESSPNVATKTATAVEGVDVGHIRGGPDVSAEVMLMSEETVVDCVVDYAGIQGQGFFAIFSGYLGTESAGWCGKNFAKYLAKTLLKADSAANLMAETYLEADSHLTTIPGNSGCTAVTVFLRLEDADGNQTLALGRSSSMGSWASGFQMLQLPWKVFAGWKYPQRPGHKPASANQGPTNARRVLYTANVGDERAVLAREGKAVRLSYDHKANDAAEILRVREAGGWVLDGRVGAALAVTRSLGHAAMKTYVIGSPYTTECQLNDRDRWLIIGNRGLWDVIDDQGAVDLVRDLGSAQQAADAILKHVVERPSDYNATVLVVKFSLGGFEIGKARA